MSGAAEHEKVLEVAVSFDSLIFTFKLKCIPMNGRPHGLQGGDLSQ